MTNVSKQFQGNKIVPDWYFYWQWRHICRARLLRAAYYYFGGIALSVCVKLFNLFGWRYLSRLPIVPIECIGSIQYRCAAETENEIRYIGKYFMFNFNGTQHQNTLNNFQVHLETRRQSIYNFWLIILRYNT